MKNIQIFGNKLQVVIVSSSIFIHTDILTITSLLYLIWALTDSRDQLEFTGPLQLNAI